MFCEALCNIILKSINNNNNNQVIIIIMSHPDSSLSKSIKTHVLFLGLECDAYCYFIGTTRNTNETKARTKAASSSRSVYLCYLLFPNCVDWNKILCTFWAVQHSKRDKKQQQHSPTNIFRSQTMSAPQKHLFTPFTRWRQDCSCQLSESAMYFS